jgi:pimeloyl-ACP methyl ester carboxylesterase
MSVASTGFSRLGVPALTLGVPALTLGALALFTARTARRVEAALPPDGRFVEVDGARIHYIERGAGPTLLLIHGLGGQAHGFTYALLDRLAESFRVVVMERPGSGYSTRPRLASAGPRAQADCVAAFIRALDLDRPVLVGHSLGGAVALATALEHPEVVGALALIAPLTHPVDAPPAPFAGLRIASPLLRWLIAWTVATPLTMLGRKRGLRVVFGPDPVPDDYPTRGGGLLGLRPGAFVTASTDMTAIPADMPALLERYASLRVPVGILFGTGDRILDHRVHGQGMTEHVPGARLEFVEGGHMLPMTNPERTAEFIRDVARSRLAATPAE